MEPSDSQGAEAATLQILYNRLLDNQVDRLLAAQRPDGAFQAEGARYSIYDQNGMYPLALSYLRPGSPHEGDPRLLDAILRSGDRHAREMNAEGQWEVITPGGRWGWGFDEWRLHFWLETVLLLGEQLGAERLSTERLGTGRLEQWDEAISRAVAGIVGVLQERLAQGLIDFVEGVCVTSPNHTAWHALVCRRAGNRYGRAVWVALADHLFELMRAAQTPDGFWVEFAAPTIGYNYTSLLALGVLWEHSGPEASPEWLDCIERGMEAQLRWSYPDGSIVAEIEGRQRSHGPNNHALPAVCARWPQGAVALRATAQRLLAQANDSHFLHSIAEVFLCETVRYLKRHEPTVVAPVEAMSSWKARGFEAGWVRHGPWQATLSGLVTPCYESRWRLDIANLVGLFHIQSGLLAGGGQSKNDPNWATFTVRADSNADPIWLPSHAELIQGSTADSLRLDYGGVKVRVDVSLTADEAHIRFALEAPIEGVSAIVRLLRPLAPGTEVCGPDGQITLLDAATPIAWQWDVEGEIGIGSARYLLPSGSSFLWPRLPFNPYNQQDLAAIGEAFAALELSLDAIRPEAAIRIRV